MIRPPAVAGAFYPADPGTLAALVDRLLADAARRSGGETAPIGIPGAASDRAPAGPPLGVLVPHAGLVYSGAVAAAAWRLLGTGPAPTVVILGTNHRDPRLDGVGAWDGTAWETPFGPVAVDHELAAAIIALGPPFDLDRATHGREHSIEVQLPVLARVSPAARIVPLSVGTGTGPEARAAGARLGRLLGEKAAGRTVDDGPVVLAISTDMAHYPPDETCRAITTALAPAILALDPDALAQLEWDVRRATFGLPGPGHRGPAAVACGMCGIEPAVLGLAALAAMGASRGRVLAAATSADAGGDPEQTVGYLAVRFDRA